MAIRRIAGHRWLRALTHTPLPQGETRAPAATNPNRSQHDVRDFLGHASITTTSRYLASSPVRLARALARTEAASDSIRTPFAQTDSTTDQPATKPSDKSLN